MSGLGIMFGIVAPQFSKDYLALLSTHIFLPMVKTLIVPLVFSLLVVGIAGHGDDLARVGRLGVKSMAYFLTLTFIAIFIGLAFGNLIRPGNGVVLGEIKNTNATAAIKSQQISLAYELNQIIPESFFAAASANKSLQVTFCAIMFACACMLVPNKEHKRVMVEFFDGLANVMLSITNLVMKFTPLAIGGALAKTIATNGIGVLSTLGKLIGTVYLGLFTFVFLILLPIALGAKVPLVPFMRQVTHPLIIAFSTASSDAALAKAMENMIELGVPREIVSFVIPVGYSFNLDGTTLYLGTAVLFAAQVANVNWSVGEQILRMLLVLLMSKGIAGVPRASLVVLAMACDNWNLPGEIVGLVLGVDEIMDMARTAVNLPCVVIARWEGVFKLYKQSSDDDDFVGPPAAGDMKIYVDKTAV
ncbi:hypothetical protein SpCBS45565_g00285 [Spizellomyces sp. 'palustris']|nr:hypothetical protein SpCBS45565_g00285 [Spizellomyces sp. 'palustris']